MQKLIAVNVLPKIDSKFSLDSQKKYALAFDRIVIPALSLHAGRIHRLSEIGIDTKRFISEYEFLGKSNTIVSDEHYTKHIDTLPRKTIERLTKIQNRGKARNLLMRSGISQMEIEQLLKEDEREKVRFASIAINALKAEDFVFPLLENLYLSDINQTSKHEVYQLILEKLPLPSPETSWEQIIEFKSDPDSNRKFLNLRIWISKMSRSGIALNEIEEELEHLLADYEHHFNIHKMKFEHGTLQTIVMGIAGIAENLATFRFSKAAEIPFKLFQQNVDLLEGEAKLPGQEIAYLFKANQTFK